MLASPLPAPHLGGGKVGSEGEAGNGGGGVLPRHGSSSATLELHGMSDPLASDASPSPIAEGRDPGAPPQDAGEARPPAAGMDAKKLVVLGLPWEAGEASLLAHFEQFGSVAVSACVVGAERAERVWYRGGARRVR